MHTGSSYSPTNLSVKGISSSFEMYLKSDHCLPSVPLLLGSGLSHHRFFPLLLLRSLYWSLGFHFCLLRYTINARIISPQCESDYAILLLSMFQWYPSFSELSPQFISWPHLSSMTWPSFPSGLVSYQFIPWWITPAILVLLFLLKHDNTWESFHPLFPLPKRFLSQIPNS